jgi:hypothetical protein
VYCPSILTSVSVSVPAVYDVVDCPTCLDEGTRLCHRCAKSHLPQLAQPHWVRLIQSSDAAKGAEAPDVARGKLTLKARQRKRALQMHRRSGFRGLAKAIRGR